MTDAAHIEFEEGSGNVFADLGLRNAEECLVRAKLGFRVVTLLKQRDLKQKDAVICSHIIRYRPA